MTQEVFADLYMEHFIAKFWAEHQDVNPTDEIRQEFDEMRFVIANHNPEDT